MASPEHDLFAVDPSEFVKARDALAKELKAAGDADAAKRVKAMRKPSVPAWALNRVARDDGDTITALVEVATEAETAQREAVSGGNGSELRAATARTRARVDDVANAAKAMIDASGRSSTTYERAISDLLHAATTSELLRTALLNGELVSADVDGDDIFGSLAASVDVTARSARVTSSRRNAKVEQRLRTMRGHVESAQALADEADEQLAQAEASVRDARSALATIERARDAAKRSADSAHEAVERVRAKLEALESPS